MRTGPKPHKVSFLSFLDKEMFFLEEKLNTNVQNVEKPKR